MVQFLNLKVAYPILDWLVKIMEKELRIMVLGINANAVTEQEKRDYKERKEFLDLVKKMRGL